MKKIIGITGIRSDYDLMSGVYKRLSESADVDFSIIVTGAQLGSRYGDSYKQIIDDGIPICCEISSLLDDDREVGRLKSLSIQLQSLSDVIDREKPDVLLVLGDREEALNLAIVGSYLNIIVAHVAGGDKVIGNVDDQVRHAVSSLAHIHFVTNTDSEQRLKKMGEQNFRIFNYGNPGLDRLINCKSIPIADVFGELNITFDPNEKYAVLLFHPLSSEWHLAGEQMQAIINALSENQVNTIIIGPNSDPGSSGIRNIAIQAAQSLNFVFEENIPRELFINILRNAYFLIGNSSLGLLEAPTLRLPALNVGNRQTGRFHAENVLFIDNDQAHISLKIKELIQNNEFYDNLKNCTQPYGSGHSSSKIANFLIDLEDLDQYRIKEVTY